MSIDLSTIQKNAALAVVEKSLFVIRWMEHEYEQGWGVTDKESHLMVYETMLDANDAIEKIYKSKRRSLFGAGDFFLYPSGPDNSYHVHEITLPENHPAVCIAQGNNSVNDRDVQRDIVLQMQSEKCTRWQIPFEGLNPKPVTSEPVITYFNPR